MKKILTLLVITLAFALSGFAADVTATYKLAGYMDVETVKAKLSAEGFEVVGAIKATDAGTTILYTNAAMKAEASKSLRGFNAVGRILVDDARKQISIANPVYFGAAFMQKEFNKAASTTVLNSLQKAFGPLKDSEDAWEAKGLSGYHFMMGMPYYEDMDTVGSGSTADLVAKAKAAQGTVVNVGGDRYVAFVELDKRTSGFVKKIGTQNGEILPYAVLIEGGQAKALNAKYYIAISYPLLTMTEFMGIATVPDAVTKGLQKIFK